MAITIFGQELQWQIEDALFWLLIAQVALVLLMLIVFAVLIHRVGKTQMVIAENVKPERKLQGLTLDTTGVERLFAPGTAFDCRGLVLIAEYNDAPVYESLTDFDCMTAEEYEAGLAESEKEDKGEKSEAAAKPVVLIPPTAEAGKAYVTVLYGGMKAVYSIEVGVRAVPAPVAVAVPAAAEEERTLLSLTLDTSMVQREFIVGEEFNCAGLLVTANYNTAPLTEAVTEYEVEEPDTTQEGKPTVEVRYGGKTAAYVISVTAAEEETPAPEETEEERTLLSLTLDTSMVQREFRVGGEFNFDGLVVTANYNSEPTSEPVTDYTVEAPDLSVEGKPTVTVTYGDKTAVYAISVTAEEVTEEVAVAAEPVRQERPAEEIESYEGGTLRYDKSFTARLIQSDDDTKQWYTEIKNSFLGYKKVHDRMSWKRETYRIGRETVARLSFRGKTLCVFLPLYAADLEGTKYKVEDVSDNVSCADTPCMYRIKNAKRARYASELFALVMDKMGVQQVERESVDYYVPYEGILELINKGLIKRDIKSKSEEAIFNKSAEETPEETPAETTEENK